MSSSKKPLWTCPKCGHQFVTANIRHSCSRHSLDDRFKDKDPRLRKIFDRYLALVRKCGPVTPRDHIHRFRLEKLEDNDEELAVFIRQAYADGRQEHLEKK